MTREATDQVTTIGIDIGKKNFHLIGFDGDGNMVLRHKLSRRQVVARFANLPNVLSGSDIAMKGSVRAKLLEGRKHVS